MKQSIQQQHHQHDGVKPALLVIKSFILLIWALCSNSVQAEPKTEQQEAYFKVRKAIRTQKEEVYLPQLQAMKDYPLYPYLFYQHNMRRLRQMDLESYQSFANQIKTTPLFLMARHHYLNYLGQYKMWKEFLQVSPNEPQNSHLKCYYFRAQAQAGDPKVAWKGAEKCG